MKKVGAQRQKLVTGLWQPSASRTALYIDKVKGKQGSTVRLLMGTASKIPDVFFLPMPANKMYLGFARMVDTKS